MPESSKNSHADAFGYRAMLAVAIPLAATVGCFAITLFTDRTLLMWYGPVSSAASVSAGNLYWALVCIPVTAMGFITPLVSLTLGTKQRRLFTAVRVWALMWQCVWLTIACLPLFGILAVFSRPIFESFGHVSQLAAEESQYFRALLLVAPASMLEAGLTAFFIGRRVTTPILRANIFAAILNVIFDFWFIFGGLGVPAMGALGAALATALAMWCKVAVFVLLLMRIRSFWRIGIVAWRPNLTMMREIVGPGSTLGIQQLVRSSLFSVVLLAIGTSSVIGLAATSAALSLYQLLSIPIIGLATAVTVFTGQAFALGGNPVARRVVVQGLCLGGLMVTTLAILLLAIPEPLLHLSLGGLSPSERAKIQPVAVTLLGYAAVYGFVDVASLLLGAAIKGLGKTAIILVATAVAGFVTVTVAYWLASESQASVVYWWSTLIIWATLQALILASQAYRLLRSPPIEQNKLVLLTK